ncbi:hypothetical protein [Streptomyces regalis]|uniref:hypothetical protein n=1 Tax=Streptomyces regalis TaxID=68262 RepID=UPI000B29E9B7|nr:hypothetical protein [Streptomyces regalis]
MEFELDRRVIAREELVEALALSAAESTAVTEAQAEQETSAAVPMPSSTVPPWREGLPVTVPAPGYQRILGVLAEQRSAGRGPVKAKEIAVQLGLGTTSAKVEGARSKARRLAARAWLLLEASGAFSAGRRPVTVPKGLQIINTSS